MRLGRLLLLAPAMGGLFATIYYALHVAAFLEGVL